MDGFSKRIKQLRTERNIFQKNIAEHLGITVRTYQYYESGELEPNLENLVKLADFFKVSMDDLLGRADNPDVK